MHTQKDKCTQKADLSGNQILFWQPNNYFSILIYSFADFLEMQITLCFLKGQDPV